MKLMEIVKKKVYSPDIRLQPYMYQTEEEIEEWMKKNHVEGFVNRELEIEPSMTNVLFNKFGTVEAFISVNGEQRLPVQFKLAPNIDVGYDEINSLIGLPYVVLGNCYINNAKLKTLEGCPKMVGGSFTLKLSNTHLQNLEGFSEHCENLRIHSLTNNRSTIDSIDGISSEIKELSIGCGFTDIANIYKNCPILEELWIMTSPKSGNKYNFLQVFNFKHLHTFYIGNVVAAESEDDAKASKIIMKHLQNDKDMLECQEELFNNGLKLYARM